MNKWLIFAVMILFGTAGAASAQALASQNNSDQSSKTAKAPKVWTDDNIDSVRSPADNYIIQQQKQKQSQRAAAEQAAEQKAAAAKAAAASLHGPQPKTVQQADQMIAGQQHFLSSEQDVVKVLQKQLDDPSVTGFERTRLEWRLKSHTATTQDTQAQVQRLEADKKALQKKAEKAEKASGNTPSASDSSQD